MKLEERVIETRDIAVIVFLEGDGREIGPGWAKLIQTDRCKEHRVRFMIQQVDLKQAVSGAYLSRGIFPGRQ